MASHDDIAVEKPEVRDLRAGDEEPVLRLLGTCFASWREGDAVARFRWKHRRSPFGPSQAAVAELNGQLVGFLAWMPWRVVLDGIEYPAWRGVDLAVDPSVQRRGIYQAIRAHRARAPEEQDLSFNHRNARSEGALRKAGLDAGSRFVQHLAPLRPHRLAHWYLSPSDRPAAASDPATHGGLRPVSDLLVDDPAIEDLLARSQPRGRLVTVRSTAYLRWRYEQYPGRRYLADALWEADGRLRGLLIGRYVAAARSHTPASFEVSELIVPEDDRAALRKLLRRVWRVDAAYAAVLPPMPLRGRGEALLTGFVRTRPIGLFGAWAHRDTERLPSDLAHPRRWQMPLGDLEAF